LWPIFPALGRSLRAKVDPTGGDGLPGIIGWRDRSERRAARPKEGSEAIMVERAKASSHPDSVRS